MLGLSPALPFERGKGHLAGNRREHARSLLRKAFKEGKNTLDSSLKTELLIALAKVDRDLGFVEDARDHYAMAAVVIRALDKPHALSHALRHEADILREQRKTMGAESLYHEVLTFYCAHSERRRRGGSRPS